MRRPIRSLVPGLALSSAALALALAWPAAAAPPAGWTPPDPALVERARALLRQTPLIDGHNDLPWELRQQEKNHLGQIDLRADTTHRAKPLHTDIPRLRRGGVGGQFWSVYVPVDLQGATAVQAVFEQIDVVHRLAAQYPDVFELALTAADVERIHRAGRIASLIGMEGGHSIGSSLAVLRELYRAGARYMTITHSKNVEWADSATDAPKLGGLSRFGEEVIREMNRLGMLVDLSHVSAETMHDVLGLAAAPVIFSHSSARALDGHPRNVPDDVLRRLPQNGGVVMATFVPSFTSEEVRLSGAARDAEEERLKTLFPGDPKAAEQAFTVWKDAHPAPRAHLAQVADHIEHIRQVAGIDHVGIGSDFDGIPATPEGLEGVEAFPVLFAELLRRGWSDADVQKLAGGNLLRVFKEVEKTAARLQRERPASDALREELDVQVGPAGQVGPAAAPGGGAQ